jgi:hypothetical protein
VIEESAVFVEGDDEQGLLPGGVVAQCLVDVGDQRITRTDIKGRVHRVGWLG